MRLSRHLVCKEMNSGKAQPLVTIGCPIYVVEYQAKGPFASRESSMAEIQKRKEDEFGEEGGQTPVSDQQSNLLTEGGKSTPKKKKVSKVSF